MSSFACLNHSKIYRYVECVYIFSIREISKYSRHTQSLCTRLYLPVNTKFHWRTNYSMISISSTHSSAQDTLRQQLNSPFINNSVGTGYTAVYRFLYCIYCSIHALHLHLSDWSWQTQLTVPTPIFCTHSIWSLYRW